MRTRQATARATARRKKAGREGGPRTRGPAHGADTLPRHAQARSLLTTHSLFMEGTPFPQKKFSSRNSTKGNLPSKQKEMSAAKRTPVGPQNP